MTHEAISLSIRLDLPDGGRFGPGKADLLEAIDASGSIAAAAKRLSMSYPRALRLVNDMNAQFSEPLIEKFQGGATRGGAKLSHSGHEVLQLYRQIVQAAQTSSGALLQRVQKTAKN